jgi:hypothetical protein
MRVSHTEAGPALPVASCEIPVDKPSVIVDRGRIVDIAHLARGGPEPGPFIGGRGWRVRFQG